MRTIRIKIYKFNELPTNEAKNKAIDSAIEILNRRTISDLATTREAVQLIIVNGWYFTSDGNRITV